MTPLNEQPVNPTHRKHGAGPTLTPGAFVEPAEPSDVLLDPLLAVALAPDAVPVDLAANIFARTRHQLGSLAWQGKASLFGHTGLLGPIGLRRLHALAAGIVLASSVGILLVSSGIIHDAYDTVTAKRQLASLSDYRGPQTALDQEISQLAVRIDAASDSLSYRDSAAARTVIALETMLPDSTDSSKQARPSSSSENHDVNLF